VTIQDTAVVRFIRKWIAIYEKKDPYFKDRGVLILQFTRMYAGSDSLGYYSLSIDYTFKGLTRNSDTIPLFYTLIKNRFVFIKVDPIFANLYSVSASSVRRLFNQVKPWYAYPHTFVIPDPAKPGHTIKERIESEEDMALVRSEYTPALLIRRSGPPISTGLTPYGWSK
jgi:hypothetical protein